MGMLVGALILIADIYAVLQIIQSSADTLKKAIWIAIVLLFPLLGLGAWFIAGPRGK